MGGGFITAGMSSILPACLLFCKVQQTNHRAPQRIFRLQRFEPNPTLVPVLLGPRPAAAGAAIPGPVPQAAQGAA